MMMGAFGILRSSLRKQRVDLAIALCAAVGAQGIGLPLPLLTRWLVNSASGADAALPVPIESLFWVAPVVVVLLALLRAGFRWLQLVRGERAAQCILVDVRARMYSHLQRLSQGYFDRRAIGKLVIRYIGDAGALRTWIGNTIIAAPAAVLTLTVIAVALGAIHLHLLIVVIVPLALLAVALLWLNPRVRSWTVEARRKQSRLCGTLGERIAGMAVIKAANAQESDRAEVDEMLHGVAESYIHRRRVEAFSQALSVGATTATLGAVGLWGAWLYSDGAVNHGDLLAAVWLTALTRGSISRLIGANAIHQRARASAERIEALLLRQPERGWSPDLSPYQGPGRTIELVEVGYKDQRGKWAFRDLTASLCGPGLVTVSSSTATAKTYFLELLLRIRRPHEGRIRLDTRDVRKLRVDDLRRQFGWVDRERRLLDFLNHADTVDPPQTLDPDQLGSVWPEGTEGGAEPMPEESRLGLAVLAALRHDPPILLLDEPTSDLDDTAVERLQRWLAEVSLSRLVVVATNDIRIHRISQQCITLRPRSSDDQTSLSSPDLRRQASS